jgi:hypothetical protein
MEFARTGSAGGFTVFFQWSNNDALEQSMESPTTVQCNDREINGRDLTLDNILADAAPHRLSK